ncbi:hypothetical protein, partial [Phytohalomonas tamaricis]|uniref:hypothetical protein n=1 Tax=Phytohalomonas tamaricis TaxID=2081032 RepID=UPI0021D45976
VKPRIEIRLQPDVALLLKVRCILLSLPILSSHSEEFSKQNQCVALPPPPTRRTRPRQRMRTLRARVMECKHFLSL